MYDLDSIKKIPITKFLAGKRKKTHNGYIYELCPFCTHKEHFFVNVKNNTYKSFNGCTGGNNIIDLVMKLEGLNFKQAVKKLAEEIGIENKELSAKAKKELEYDYVFGLLESIRIQNIFNKFFKYLKEKKLDSIFEYTYKLDENKLIQFIYNFKAKYGNR